MTQPNTLPTSGTPTTRTINDLRRSPYNVRTNAADNAAVASLEASILKHGLLKPLIIHPFKGSRPKKWGVLAGGRRYRAIRNLVDRGAVPVDWPIDIVERDLPEAELYEISLHENLSKELRPYEIYAAVARCVQKGISIEDMAEHYGLTPREMAQYRRLGTLAPPIFAALEAGTITLVQARAYAATEDQALQLHAWDQLSRAPSYSHTDRAIRAALGVGEAEARRLLAYVGAEAYRTAGGRYELDLFADDGEERGLVTDPGLLRTLANARLDIDRATLRKRTGRDLRFAEPPRHSYGSIDYALQVEAVYADLDGFDAARAAELERAIADCVEQAEEQLDEFGNPLPGAEAAIAAIRAAHDPAEAELEAIMRARRIILPEGDVVAWLRVNDHGTAEVTFWWADAKAKRAHEKATAAGVSLKPVGAPTPSPAAPKVLEGTAVRGNAAPAAALAREEHGVSADSIEVTRSIRRELLRALLVEDAEQSGYALATTKGTLGTDYVVWAMLRNELGDGRPERTGARGIAYGGEIGGTDLAAKARGHVEMTEAHRVWQAAIAQLSRQSFITNPDHAAAFLDYQAESAATKRLAGAVLAGLALERSANTPGYRIPVHDALAQLARATPATMRRLWEPTAEFLDLIPRAHRLAIAEPIVDEATHARWAKVKAAELTQLLARALGSARNGVRQGAKQIAAEWVHPLLAFRPRDFSERQPDAGSLAEVLSAAELHVVAGPEADTPEREQQDDDVALQAAAE